MQSLPDYTAHSGHQAAADTVEAFLSDKYKWQLHICSGFPAVFLPLPGLFTALPAAVPVPAPLPVRKPELLPPSVLLPVPPKSETSEKPHMLFYP